MEQKIIENRASFFARLQGRVSVADMQAIAWAYDLAKLAHRVQLRDNRTRYFEHPRAVALILMDELKCYDPIDIIVALLHDTGEDTPLWGSMLDGYETWLEQANYRIPLAFPQHETVKNRLIAMTKPVDRNRFVDKASMMEFYLHQLQSTPGGIQDKMLDRLHNLRDLETATEEKVRRQIKETQTVLLPYFNEIDTAYGTYLRHNIAQQIAYLKAQYALTGEIWSTTYKWLDMDEWGPVYKECRFYFPDPEVAMLHTHEFKPGSMVEHTPIERLVVSQKVANQVLRQRVLNATLNE